MSDTSNNFNGQIIPLFRLGFRPFFLGAAIFSLISLTIWGLYWLAAFKSYSPYGGWLWWHAHEMLFGFSVAVIVGFLITAIQTWTGQPSISGWPLFGLFCVWVAARVLLLFPSMPSELLLLIDVSFLLISAFIMAWLAIRANQKQQLIFSGLLLLLAVSNAEMHWAVMKGDYLLTKIASHGGIFLIVLMIVVMGGRVIPFFTANGTQTQRKNPLLLVEILAFSSVAILALLNITGWVLDIPSVVTGLLFLLAGISNLIRLLNWRPWVTFKVPLLWSLHAAYLMIVIGFFLAAVLLLSGLSYVYHPSYTSILHSFTIGGPGLLVLAMMARVSLGHTGRELSINGWMSLSFLLMIAAYICRVLLPILLPASGYYLGYVSSIAFWLLAYGIFVFIYFPVLTQARVDGQSG